MTASAVVLLRRNGKRRNDQKQNLRGNPMNAQPYFTSISPARRPSWSARKPDLELDCRTLDARGAPIFKSILDAADRLAPGHILSVLIDFEPTLLYHLLDRRGCEHWNSPVDAGERRVYFFKRRRV